MFRKFTYNRPICIFKHKPNGIGANWNNCIKNSTGKYIKFLFQDDILNSKCVEEMLNIAIHDENIGLVFSKRDIISETNNLHLNTWKDKFGELHNHWGKLQTINSGKLLLKRCKKLLHTPMSKVGEPTAVLINKKVFYKIGYFSEDLSQVLDFEFWYRVFKYYKIGFINKSLVKFRLHKDQASHSISYKKDEYIIYEKKILKNLFFQLHPKVQFKLLIKYVYFIHK